MYPPTTIRFLTWNIAHGRGSALYQGFKSEKQLRRNLSRIAQFFKQRRIDVVCLQEVDKSSHWNKRLDLLEILREETGYEHALHGINNLRTGRKPLAYGNAILSRYPVHFWENSVFSKATFGGNGFMYAEVVIGDVHLPVINLHLDFRSKKKRIIQVGKVIDYIKSRKSANGSLRPIVCGDFNTSSKRVGDAVQQMFEYLLSSGDYKLYPIKTRTFPALLPSRSLDFVFLPAPLEKKHSEVCRVVLSDHRPVLVDIELR